MYSLLNYLLLQTITNLSVVVSLSLEAVTNNGCILTVSNIGYKIKNHFKILEHYFNKDLDYFTLTVCTNIGICSLLRY